MKEKSLPSRILAGAGAAVGVAVARNPKPVMGGAVFVVAFSFVAANALWYQPGGHPSPFLATRDAGDPNGIAGFRPAKRADPQDVTTFRIERAPAESDEAGARRIVADPGASQGGGQPAQATIPAAPAAPVDDIESIIAGQSGPDRPLVAGIQRELASRGLYDGADDGLMGPRTEAAILFFEEAAGLPQRGMPTAELLALLQSQSQAQGQGRSPAVPDAASSPAQLAAGSMPTPIPRQAPRADARPVSVASRSQNQPASQAVRATGSSRPAEKISARGEDPITSAIRAAERQPNMTPPGEIPGSTRLQASRSAANPQPAQGRRSDYVPSSQLVLQIQKGLSNIAYTDVEVDGVAGSQTKAAIRRFQKHYRLPETGEPDEVVLKKLKAIGAL